MAWSSHFKVVGYTPYNNLAASIALLNATAEDWTLIIPRGTHTISADLTSDSNIKLIIHSGANIAIANGVTLTINGPIEAGPYQIFSWTGTGKVDIARNPVLVEWWGIDGTADNVSFQAAIDSLPVAGGCVKALGPSYALAGGITVPSYTTLEFSIGTAISYDSTDAVAIKLTGGAANYCTDSKVINPRITASGDGVSRKGIQVYGGLRCKIDHAFITGFTSGIGIELTGNEEANFQDIKTLLVQPAFTNCLIGIRFGASGATHWASEFTVIEGHVYWSGANTAALIGYDINYGILGTLIECSTNTSNGATSTAAIGIKIGQNCTSIKIIGGNQEALYDGIEIHSSCDDIIIMGPAFGNNAGENIDNNITSQTGNYLITTTANNTEIPNLYMLDGGQMILGGYYFIGNSTNGWLSIDQPSAAMSRLQAFSANKAAVGSLTITGRYGASMTQLILDATKLTLSPVPPTYADNAAALGGGLTAGDIYRTATGVLMVTYTP